MQEHVELEVSLEIIMAKIAEEMFRTKENNDKLDELIKVQEKAYEGDRDAVTKILKGEI